MSLRFKTDREILLLNAKKRPVWSHHLAIGKVTCSSCSCLRRSSFFLAVLWSVRSSGEALQVCLALTLIRFLALLCSSVVDGNSTEHTSNSAVRLGVLGLAVKPSLLTSRKSVAVTLSVCADKASSMTLRNSCWTCFWGSGVLGSRVVLREEHVALDLDGCLWFSDHRWFHSVSWKCLSLGP